MELVGLSEKGVRKVEALVRQHSVKTLFSNGEGMILEGPRYLGEINYPVDYYILLGEVPVHTIYRFLTKIKVGGILVAEVDSKPIGMIKEMILFLNKVASQHSYYYFVDGIKYIFITRLES